MTFSHAIWLAISGGLRTLVRASVAILALRLCGRETPWGTFAVNLIGSFLFGVIISLGRGRIGLPAGYEPILLVGFLGGFTTYSSFAFQSYAFLEQGRPFLAGVYVVGTVISGLVCVWAGVMVGRLGGG
jgi:CrcB protein